MTTIYLDHNATTPLLAEVAEAMHECQLRYFGNASSQHQIGRRARQVIEDARESIGRMLGAEVDRFHSDKVIFTSGGTEANHLALHGLLGTERSNSARVILSAVEHPSIAGNAEQLARNGVDVRYLAVDSSGLVRLDELGDLLTPNTRLLSVMLGNNETGVLQPLAPLVELCRERNIAVHSDAVQVVGKRPVNFRALGVSAMTVAPHKFHGPVGIGALIVRHGTELSPQLFGGHQQEGLRPGTESVALVVGFRRALELWHEQQAARAAQLLALREQFERQVQAACPDVLINGAAVERLPHTSNVAFLGVDRQALLMALDLEGIACSAGSACASGSSEPSPTLRAMGLADTVLSSSLRFSFGAPTTPAEVAEAVDRISLTYHRLRQTKIAGKTAPLGRSVSASPL